MLNLIQVEFALRIAAITLLATVCLSCLRESRSYPAIRYAIFLSISLIAMLATTGPLPPQEPNATYAMCRLVALGNIFFVWLFGRAVFNEVTQFDYRVIAVGLIWYFINTPRTLVELGLTLPSPAIWQWGTNIVAFCLLGNLCWMALKGHEEDLVETRRRLRRPFILAMVGVVSIIVVAENYHYLDSIPMAVSLFRDTSTALLALFALLWLVRLQPSPLLPLSPISTAPSSTTVRARDQLELDRLNEAVLKNRAWAEHGLTIRQLSEQVNIPEHRLRRLINQTMGHRNFSSFLTEFRLKEVKRLLADPGHAHLPILTLAMDAGFASLAPFNRSFRAAEGMPPSAWREVRLSEQITKNSQAE